MRLALVLALSLTELEAAAATPRLAFVFTPDAGILHVQLTVDHLAAETRLVIPTAWGNAIDLQKGVTSLRALEGTLIKGDDPNAATVRASRGRVRIAYDLIQDWRGALREEVRHRPHIDATHVEFNTGNALVHPEMDAARVVDCRFEWVLPAGWSLATSFGALRRPEGRTRQTYRGQWNGVANAMYVAGDFRLFRTTIDGGEVVTAIRGKFGFPDVEVIDQVSKLIRIEREFWQDKDFPYFLVTLAPFGAGQSSSGGSGFTNAFNLHTSPHGAFTPELLSLVSHETFHTWNPIKMGRIREDASWFTEGFTRYYQDLLLLHAGLTSNARYLQALNRRIYDYQVSPARALTWPEIKARPRQDDSKSQIPERGFMIALWLDSEIRRQSQGRRSLDALMRSLFRERKRHPDLTNERLYAAIGRFVDNTASNQVRRFLESGVAVEAPEKIRVNCATREVKPMRAFDLGMDRATLLESHRVTGLRPGSAAERAGLKEGDVVARLSIHWNDTTKPVRLSLKGGGAIEYLPLGRSLGPIPQYSCPDVANPD